MKFFALLFLWTLPVLAQDLYSRRGELERLPVIPSEVSSTIESKRQKEILKKVKYFFVNGNLPLARLQLTKLAYSRTKERETIYRYLGILHFIHGEFEKSLSYLSRPELSSPSPYAKICVLKVLDQIVLDKKQDIELEWVRCQTENSDHLKEGHLAWIETLVRLKLYPYRGVTSVPFKRVNLSAFENDQVKVIMKLALYLNREDLISHQIQDLSVEQLQDPEIRELAGHILFRLGALAKSYKFIEDLKSPNAENIKGNLYLLRNKYELAYAQFKLAIEQKQNSQNAMERILPLAWLLGDWEDGAKFTERVIASPQTQVNKLTLLAAFLTQKGDFEKATQVLESIAQRSRRGTEVDVTQLHGFVALMQNRPQVVKKQAELSCAQYDLVNCWLLLQMHQWDAFPLTMRRTDKLPSRREWEKLSNEALNSPLKETVFVNQLDVEELDDKLVRLVPKDQ